MSLYGPWVHREQHNEDKYMLSCVSIPSGGLVRTLICSLISTAAPKPQRVAGN